jgi:hypothetical protein
MIAHVLPRTQLTRRYHGNIADGTSLKQSEGLKNKDFDCSFLFKSIYFFLIRMIEMKKLLGC